MTLDLSSDLLSLKQLEKGQGNCVSYALWHALLEKTFLSLLEEYVDVMSEELPDGLLSLTCVDLLKGTSLPNFQNPTKNPATKNLWNFKDK